MDNNNAFKICSEHRWPRLDLAGAIDSTGSTFIKRCNNCVALQITFKTCLLNGEQVEKTNIIVP